MEPENNLEDYKPITVQEDMYADRLEWIPKEMSPSQEYITLISILERHPCQSLRCLDKLTAQIYGGTDGIGNKLMTKAVTATDSKKMASIDWQQKPEYKDKMDDVLKQLYGNDGSLELRDEVIKKNKEYLSIEESVDGKRNKHKHKIKSQRDKRDMVNTKFMYEKRPARYLKERDVERNLQSLLPDHLDERPETGKFKTFVQDVEQDLPDRADLLIDDAVTRHEADTNNYFITDHSQTSNNYDQHTHFHPTTNGNNGHHIFNPVQFEDEASKSKESNIDSTNLDEPVSSLYHQKFYNASSSEHNEKFAGGTAIVSLSLASEASETRVLPDGGAEECASVITSHRYDCHPELGASEEQCLSRGCCWRAVQRDFQVEH